MSCILCFLVLYRIFPHDTAKMAGKAAAEKPPCSMVNLCAKCRNAISFMSRNGAGMLQACIRPCRTKVKKMKIMTVTILNIKKINLILRPNDEKKLGF